MTDEQIEKALEHCLYFPMRCEGCPYHGMSCCHKASLQDYLHLIKRQKTEIEGLLKAVDYWMDEVKITREDLNQSTAEARIEAIREFAERLKGCILERDDEIIDSIAREMTEEQR